MTTPLEVIVGHGRVTRRRHRLIGLAATGAMAVTAALAVGLASSAPAHGAETLTINPKVFLEPGTLQSDLAEDGIPAKVTVGSFCFSDPAPAGLLRVLSIPQTQHVRAITINPAAIPAGAELSFGYFQLAGKEQTNFALIDKSSYTCTPHAMPLQRDSIAIWGAAA